MDADVQSNTSSSKDLHADADADADLDIISDADENILNFVIQHELLPNWIWLRYRILIP